MIEMSLKLKRAVTIAALACLLAGGLAVRVSLSAKLRVPSGDEGPWLRLTRSAWTAEFMHSRVVEHDLYGAREIPHPEDNRSPLFPLLAGLDCSGFSDAAHPLRSSCSIWQSLLHCLWRLPWGHTGSQAHGQRCLRQHTCAPAPCLSNSRHSCTLTCLWHCFLLPISPHFLIL